MTLVVYLDQIGNIGEGKVCVERSEVTVLDRILIGSSKIPFIQLESQTTSDAMRCLPIGKVRSRTVIGAH